MALKIKKTVSFRLNRICGVTSILVAIFGLLVSIIYQDNLTKHIGIPALTLFLLYCVYIAYLCLKSKVRYDPIIIMLSIVAVLYISQRFCTLIIHPENKYYNVFFFKDEYLKAWIIIFLFTFSAVIGVYASKFLWRLTTKTNSRAKIIRFNISRRRLYTFFGILLAAYFLTLVNYYYLGGNSTVFDVQTSLLAKTFSIIGNIDLYLIIIFCMVFQRYVQTRQFDKKLGGFCIIAYSIVRILSGSRAGLYDGLIIIVICILAYCPRLEFRLSIKYLGLLATAIILAPLTFIAGDLMRFVTWKPDRTLELFSEYSLSSVLGIFSISDLLMVISRRLSLIDPMLFIFNEKSFCLVSDYLNLSTMWQSAVNRVVPGSIFPYVIESERVFAILFGGREESSVVAHFHADLYSSFGMAYLLFGSVFGLLCVFLSSVIFSYFCNIFRSNRKHYLALTLFVFYFWLLNFGIDNLVARFAYFIPLFLVYSSVFIEHKMRKERI